MPAILPPYYVDAPAIVRPAQPVAEALALSGFEGGILLVSTSGGPNAAMTPASTSGGPNATMRTTSTSGGPNAAMTTASTSGGPNSAVVRLGPTGRAAQTSPLGH